MSRPELFQIQGMPAGERYTIAGTESMDDLPNSKRALIASGKEPVRYAMARHIEGTRKKPQTVYAWRFEKSGRFISIL